MASVSSYLDGRPGAHLRLDANDQGIVFEYGNGPDGCDDLGAREASVVLHEGVFHLFYDGAKADVGWRACLATSADLKNWRHHGPILELGEERAPDSATATSPWFFYDNGLWHSYYLGCRQITPKPDCVPSQLKMISSFDHPAGSISAMSSWCSLTGGGRKLMPRVVFRKLTSRPDNGS